MYVYPKKEFEEMNECLNIQKSILFYSNSIDNLKIQYLKINLK